MQFAQIDGNGERIGKKVSREIFHDNNYLIWCIPGGCPLLCGGTVDKSECLRYEEGFPECCQSSWVLAGSLILTAMFLKEQDFFKYYCFWNNSDQLRRNNHFTFKVSKNIKHETLNKIKRIFLIFCKTHYPGSWRFMVTLHLDKWNRVSSWLPMKGVAVDQ